MSLIPCRNFLVTSYWLLVPLVVLGLLLPHTARMQTPFIVCGGTIEDPESPGYQGIDPLTCTLGHLLDVPVRIYNFLLGLAALVLLAVILISGLRMMWYYGAELPEAELAAAKNMLTRGLVGFAIVAAAYLAVNVALAVLSLNQGSWVGQTLQGFELLVPWDPLR